MFYVVTQTCGMILTVCKKNLVTFVQKLCKPFFCVLKKTHVIVCTVFTIMPQQSNNRRETEWFHRMYCVIL